MTHEIKPNPIQPIFLDRHGVMRFKDNKIVRYLLDYASARGCSLNELACMEFSDDDRRQLAQLIGYSVGGFSDLSYVSDAFYEQVDKAVEEFKAQGIEPKERNSR